LRSRTVELSNFRVYGEDFALSLPDGPGVTLISGPNGMGKTTFFDSLEWALTGEIRRFAPYLGKRSHNEHLTRLGAPEQSHRVSLYFNEGDPIDRTAEYGQTAPEIAARLKIPSWPQISDLYSYLSITHFLGQSSEQRFSVKKPSEQWQALRGPAGVDRLNWAKDRIGSQATRMAFTRAIKDCTSELEAARSAFDEWRGLLARRSNSNRLASVRPLNPEDVSVELDALERDLILFTKSNDRNENLGLEVSGRVDGFRRRLLEITTGLSHRVNTLAELETLPTDTSTQKSELTTVGAKISETETEIADRQLLLSELVDRVGKQERDRARRDLELRALRTEQESFVKLQVAIATIAESEKSIQELQVQFRELEQSTKRQESERERASEQRSGRISLLMRRDGLLADLESTRDRLSSLQSYKAAVVDLTDYRAANLSTDTTLALQAESQKSELAITGIDNLIREIRQQLESLNNRDATIASAVAIIASHLHSEDKECPVCGTHFEVGMLATLARDAKIGRDAIVGDLTAEISRFENEKSEANSRIVDLRKRLAELDRVDRTIRQKEEIVRRLGLEMSSFGFDLSGIDQTEIHLKTRANSLEDGYTRIEEEILLAADSVEIDSRLEAVRSALSIADARRGALTLEMEQLQSRRDAASNLVGRETERLHSQGLAIARWREYLEASIVQASSKAEEMNQLEAGIETGRIEITGLRDAIATVELRLGILIEKQKGFQLKVRALEDRWGKAGLPLPPEMRSILREQDSVRALQSLIDTLMIRLNEVSEGYKSWLEDRELRAVTDDIASRVRSSGLHSEEAFDSFLQGKIAYASDRLERASKARILSEELVHSLQEKADLYSQQVLSPLNTCIRQFSRALMTRADDSVAYRAEHYANRSELKPEIKLRGGNGRLSSLEMNPNLYFSEGQLAALSVSALFAASTCFRWSRWRALLLDDPLQHSDVIHASAFVDVILNLVKELQYQVVISTHDDAEFSYMARKLESASVPVSRCELRIKGGLGRAGAFVELDR
jgi:DNA repair exonuclease SbcCD ATPase subunit